MSKEGNMEELQRYWTETDNPHTFSENADGAFVRFSDVQEREARLQARIEELEVIVSGKTMYDAAAVADARWRKRLEVEAKRFKNLAWNARKECSASGDLKADIYRDAYQRVRSLLDSGEEQKASEPAIYEGYGRKWEPVKGTSALREVGDTGPDWDQCVYHMIGGRVQRFLMAEREAMPSPSPALHREGRGDFIGDDLSGVHTCHAECPCRESGPDPVAVPEKVEVNREDLELILTDTDIYYPGYAEDSDEPSGLPERGAAAEDRLRAALAAFRATEDGSHE